MQVLYLLNLPFSRLFYIYSETGPPKPACQPGMPRSVVAIKDIGLPEVDFPKQELQWMPLLLWNGSKQIIILKKSIETCDIPVAMWGQSIGTGVATSLAAQLELFSQSLTLNFMILETQFLSIRPMLEKLCPQEWVLYRHIWPFLWNILDS
jgi:hypothetical protein